jgi:RHS repeat-associated protein
MPAYRTAFISPSWHGSLLTDKADASGQLYRRNRYYDPGTGRFTQEDPIGLAGGLNVYGFADGDPVNFADPFGTCPVMLSLAVLATVDGPLPFSKAAWALGCATEFTLLWAASKTFPHAETSRAARRRAMRDAGVPTSRPPDRQCKTDEGGVQYQYDERNAHGKETGRTDVVEHHKGKPGAENAHDRKNHWEAGEGKDPKQQTRRDGTRRLKGDKSKCTYGPDPSNLVP